ncbi:polyprenyl synthetase family protein [Anaplasma phagocytophilum]|uniref:polyprenyl synthetase family protein n=1 Tax=Anaplasma phagocytophilum TaxID=948 RepID=UPI00200D9DE1|nr:polyprenyl synthetase family protein [Anaplasma phagocytophilum]UQD54335.1 polyprenyl synthetase family protein [Anaplasma phagocytophilum]
MEVPNTFSSALDDLKILVASELQEMESLIAKQRHSEVQLIADIIQHLILSGGKRTRPVMLLSACGMLGCIDERRIVVAAAIEFLHSATLLHDDVVDKSDMRRGVETANSIWGNKASILVGDFLFATAFQWIVSCNSIQLLSVLSNTASIIVSGEMQQLVHSSSLDISRTKYLEIISSKTAALFSAACESAAVLHDVGTLQRNALRDWGFNFGIVFQILDDILDYTANQNELGKRTYNDIVSGKVTLPLIIAYEGASEKDRIGLRGALSRERPDPDLAFSYIMAQNAIEKSVELAKEYIAIAEKQLSHFPASAYKQKLLNLLNGAVNRRF